MSNVIFYSGWKINETPRKILYKGKEIDVYLVQESLLEDFNSGKRERIFIVSDKLGNKYRIRRNGERYFIDSWE